MSLSKYSTPSLALSMAWNRLTFCKAKQRSTEQQQE
jgi:hypothetical protein